MKTCVICHKSYTRSNFKKYCSYDCFKHPKFNNFKKTCFVASCKFCDQLVLKYKSEIKGNLIFCNNHCSASYFHKNKVRFSTKKTELVCFFCDKKFNRINYKIIPNQRVYCSTKCSGTAVGLYFKPEKRSRLEKYIEREIKFHFPYINILFNTCELIKLELDIYFPDLNLAIEINGPFHYTAIFSEKELKATQLRDNRKMQYCVDLGIELLIIKAIKKFSIKNAKIIWNIIYEKILEILPYCRNIC